MLVKTDEIKTESPPEQEEPTVKQDENLPPVIIINKGKFSLQKVITKATCFILPKRPFFRKGFNFCLLPLILVIHTCIKNLPSFYNNRGSCGENRRDTD